MALTSLKAVVKKQEGLAVEAKAREFKVKLDEPKDLGGTNTGMNPMEMILCGLGGCQTIATSIFAKKFNIDIQDLWIELEGDIDTDGFMGLKDIRPGYQAVRYNIHIKSDDDQEKVKELIEYVEKHCPVGDTIANMVKLQRTNIIIDSKIAK